LIRFVVIIIAALLGLFGVQFALLALIIHLVFLRSFGHPYMAPYGPFIWQEEQSFMITGALFIAIVPRQTSV